MGTLMHCPGARAYGFNCFKNIIPHNKNAHIFEPKILIVAWKKSGKTEYIEHIPSTFI